MTPQVAQWVEQAKRQVPPGLDSSAWLDHYHGALAQVIVQACADLIETRDPRLEPAAHIYLLKTFGVNNND